MIIEVGQLLIKSGAKINTKDDDGNTPLHVVRYYLEKEDDMYEKIQLGDLLAILIDKGGQT